MLNAAEQKTHLISSWSQRPKFIHFYFLITGKWFQILVVQPYFCNILYYFLNSVCSQSYYHALQEDFAKYLKKTPMHTVQKSITAYYEGSCFILHSLFAQNSCCSALKLIFAIETLLSCSYTKETIHDWIIYQFKSNLSKLQETSWVAVWIKWSLNNEPLWN